MVSLYVIDEHLLMMKQPQSTLL
ncbi:uncharacterized protein METZ01_LOCUS499015 [marine metagenome]|uniref:Uncharacterized protein n=1 Tax=marine metagenome TaxID=408172 RepID=A0A383DNU1_9ZZZZ